MTGGWLPGAATAEAPDELPLQVSRLVRQLDDNQLATREAAERGLIDLGPRALDLLPSPGRDTSAEVRVRLERVRKTLQEQAAKNFAKKDKPAKDAAYICPMGCAKSDKPGKCPKCKMELKKQ